MQIFLIWLLIFHQRPKRLSISTKPARVLKDFVFFFLLSYLVCSQIWLNHLMDDHHFFSYITTKLTPKKKTWVLNMLPTWTFCSMSMKPEQLCNKLWFNPISKHICSHHGACTKAKTWSTKSYKWVLVSRASRKYILLLVVMGRGINYG